MDALPAPSAAIEIENHLPWPQHGRLCLLQEVLSGASDSVQS